MKLVVVAVLLGMVLTGPVMAKGEASGSGTRREEFKKSCRL